MKVRIRNNHFLFDSTNYFTGRSTDVQLGTYGQKREPITGANYLETYRHFPIGSLQVEHTAIPDLQFEQTTAGDVSVSAALQVVGGGAFSTQRLLEGELKLMKFSIVPATLQDALNNNPRALDYLAEEGDDARICHQIFVVTEGRIRDTWANATSVEAEMEDGDIRLTAQGTGSGQTVITINDDFTFAYLLLKFKWNAGKKSKRTRIIDVSTDQWGPS